MSIQDLIYMWEADAQIPHRSIHYPHWPERDEIDRRLSFIEEEFEELLEAERDRDLVGVADALGDLIWVIYGTANAFGIDLDEVLEEISRSNDTKLIDASFSEEGKLEKGPYYDPPMIEDILERQGMR